MTFQYATRNFPTESQPEPPTDDRWERARGNALRSASVGAQAEDEEATRRVREREGRVGDTIPCDRPRSGLAHPSIPFPVYLNADWRIVDDPLQWILQKRKGRPRSKNSGWRSRYFLHSRKGLLDYAREYSGEVSADALEALSRLPEWHR